MTTTFFSMPFDGQARIEHNVRSTCCRGARISARAAPTVKRTDAENRGDQRAGRAHSVAPVKATMAYT